MTMDFTLQTPTLLFSAISLLMLAYTNRFVVIANLIRELYAQHIKEPSEITFEQLDFTNKNGLADGLSKSIIENMNKLSIYQRPMHCTDIKRETLYIKDEDNWSKDKSKEKIKGAIKKASSKNFNALMDWKMSNPDYMNSEDKTDYFTKTISTIGKPSSSIDEKVIKNLCKETYVKNSDN